MRRLVPLTLVVAACADPGAPAPAADDSRPGFASGNAAACVLNTKLAPENEPLPTNTSEATGHAQVKVRNDGTIEWKAFILNKAEETFFAGHIHRGRRGMSGPIVVPTTTFIPPTSDKTIQTRGESAAFPVVAADLCANPAEYYINFHTVDNPAGATRGQLGD
jgi:hypothetical protein